MDLLDKVSWFGEKDEEGKTINEDVNFEYINF